MIIYIFYPCLPGGIDQMVICTFFYLLLRGVEDFEVSLAWLRMENLNHVGGRLDIWPFVFPVPKE